MSKQETIVVLGAFRSGTSMIAETLIKLGINMGEPNQWDNDHTRFYEDKPFVRLSNEINKHYGNSWKNPASTKELQILNEQNNKFRDRFIELVAERNNKHDIWGWKDPKACIFIHAFHKYLRNPKFVCIARNEYSEARSICNLWKGIGSMEKAISLIWFYKWSVNHFFVKHDYPRIYLRYENFLANKHDYIDLCTFLDIDVNHEVYQEVIKQRLDHSG